MEASELHEKSRVGVLPGLTLIDAQVGRDAPNLLDDPRAPLHALCPLPRPSATRNLLGPLYTPVLGLLSDGLVLGEREALDGRQLCGRVLRVVRDDGRGGRGGDVRWEEEDEARKGDEEGGEGRGAERCAGFLWRKRRREN